MDSNQKQAPSCPFLGPRQCLPAWVELGVDKVLLTGIARGVAAPLHGIPAPNHAKPGPWSKEVGETIGDYLRTGVIRELHATERARTNFWVPTFPRAKKDGGIRLITDLRRLNDCQRVRHHKSETWTQVLDVLADPKLTWAVKLDIKSFFHHLEVRGDLQRWMRFRIGPAHSKFWGCRLAGG